MNFRHLLEKYKRPSKKGFTLVEMVVTVAVVAIAAGATLSVFVMVKEVSQKAAVLTKQQYYTGQTERMIRNEFQVASNVDIALAVGLENGKPLANEAKKNDEYMKYDPTMGRVTFYRANKDKEFSELFTIDEVNEVEISIAPLNDVVADKSGQNYKMFYIITTKNYEYSGGFVLSNTVVQGKEDKSFKKIGDPTNAHTILWRSDANGGSNGTGSPNYGNTFALMFHRDTSGYNASTSSTP